MLHSERKKLSQEHQTKPNETLTAVPSSSCEVKKKGKELLQNLFFYHEV